MVNLTTVKSYAYKKVWGEHSLSIGEIIGFVIGILIMWFKWLGKWSFLVGAVVIFLSMMLA